MKQGGTPPTGKWIGSPTGGVTAPEPLMLPDLTSRFSATAARLRALADGHPMEKWLDFMALLSDAQHNAAMAPAAMPATDPSLIAQSVEARMPPLAADGHQRHSAWRDGLTTLLDELDGGDIPAPAAAVIADVRLHSADDIEDLADRFLRGSLDPADVGPALYVAAALQVYFTRLAASLDASTLRLLPQRGLCPCCGSTPVSGLITASGPTPGTRYLYCSLCSTAWNHVRVICITCEGSGALTLKGIEGGSAAVQAETCDDCRTYAKMLYQGKDTKVDPYADDLASLGLDIMVSEAGWARHAPNPLLLVVA
ncbi:MAG: formate dehydrogenase accessory protein FdhE [Hyphomicrobium sp.]|uniref:formate dehydrogenase accessory protein FdhE n=1 Tax=Hyphomicrobium sp. TaxID=82 RepID=UPI0039E24A83